MFAYLLVKVQQKSTWAGIAAAATAIAQYGFTQAAVVGIISGVGLMVANA